jgi:hypothetical protein
LTQQVAHARVILPSTDANTDNCSIDFYAEATGSDTTLDFTDSVTPQTVVEQFFNTASGTHAVAYYINSIISRATNACQIDWTDITAHLDGSPAGTPFRTDTFTLGTSAGTQGLPATVAACVALRRAYGSDLERGSSASLPTDEAAQDEGAPATHTGVTRPRARDRGRIYIGPLNISALNSSVPGTWDPTFTTSISDTVYNTYATQNGGQHNQFNFVLWSRRNASVGDCSYYYLNEGCATVRRRGDTTQARVHAWNLIS